MKTFRTKNVKNSMIKSLLIYLLGVCLLGCDIVQDDPDLSISDQLNAIKNSQALWNISESIPPGSDIQITNSPSGQIEFIGESKYLAYSINDITANALNIESDVITFDISNKGDLIGSGILNISLFDELESDNVCGVLPNYDKTIKFGEKFELSFTEESIFCNLDYKSALITIYGGLGERGKGVRAVGSTDDGMFKVLSVPESFGAYDIIFDVSNFSSESPFISPNVVNQNARLELHSFMITINVE